MFLKRSIKFHLRNTHMTLKEIEDKKEKLEKK